LGYLSLQSPKQQPMTEDFTLQEFTRSRTATRLGIDNTPDESAIENLNRLCQQFLQPVRNHFGEPIIITSGYRCPKLNEAVGGVPDSYHVTGEAADFTLVHMPATDAFNIIHRSLDVPYTELIYYPQEDRLHVGVTGENSQQTLIERNGKYLPAS
jgi:uncharacterized protein YcbK (DUF882 family)